MTDIGASENSQSQEKPDDQGPIVAGPGQYHRVMRYLMCIGMIAFGAWFGYDGWVGWPRMNEQIRTLKAAQQKAINSGDKVQAKMIYDQLSRLNNGEEKNDANIWLQKALCVVLPILGIGILVRALYRSRGRYRLEGTTLTVPGHPPVPFENITEIDRRLWDKKGIAYIHYDLGDGRKGRILLDDFIYDRPPTDAIYERIEAYVDPDRASRTETDSESTDAQAQKSESP
ncbi:MAG TPA: hypothetical protein VH518_18300 [Tepidisphaeraceae bacterium]|jgi:hypothetical protein